MKKNTVGVVKIPLHLIYLVKDNEEFAQIVGKLYFNNEIELITYDFLNPFLPEGTSKKDIEDFINVLLNKENVSIADELSDEEAKLLISNLEEKLRNENEKRVIVNTKL